LVFNEILARMRVAAPMGVRFYCHLLCKYKNKKSTFADEEGGRNKLEV
jgi:hypothetical protein